MENKNDKRTSRASQTREKTAQKKVRSPPSALNAPKLSSIIETSGYAFCIASWSKGIMLLPP